MICMDYKFCCLCDYGRKDISVERDRISRRYQESSECVY